ncbi:hypothetical protein [Pelagibius sp. Alg239-R121]|uniref:hypothetical protein n=1 Tax=Pelagibius sp. Alg239-R121 TaxID=2993448 RepID=UPI0024A7944D|nr:hypothetical protein [Pelagibius sp. Alg239-R121]
MSRKNKNDRRIEVAYGHLPESSQSIVIELARVFASRQHDLWSGETYHASSLRFEELAKLRGKNLDALSNGELDRLMFCVMTTIGSQQTMKFLLPRFFAAYFSKPAYGWIAEPWVIVDRLVRADFDAWPEGERQTVLEAIVLAAQMEIDRDEDHNFVSEDNRAARDWAKSRLNELA